MGVEGFGQMLANYQVNPNEWQRQVLDGKFLQEGNPYQQALVDESLEAYERSLGALDSRFASSGRFGSGALMGGHVMANEEANEGIQQMLAGLHDSERNRMTQVLGMLSQENQGARSTLGGVQQSSIAAAAQRAAAQMQLRGVMAQVAAQKQALGAQTRQQAFGNQLALLNAAGGMDDRRNANAMLPYEMLQSASQFGLPLLSTFGTQNQHTQGTNVQPGAGVNPWTQGIMGGLGGMMGGLSLGRGLGMGG
jgi:hypothetical protein